MPSGSWATENQEPKRHPPIPCFNALAQVGYPPIYMFNLHIRTGLCHFEAGGSDTEHVKNLFFPHLATMTSTLNAALFVVLFLPVLDCTSLDEEIFGDELSSSVFNMVRRCVRLSHRLISDPRLHNHGNALITLHEDCQVYPLTVTYVLVSFFMTKLTGGGCPLRHFAYVFVQSSREIIASPSSSPPPTFGSHRSCRR